MRTLIFATNNENKVAEVRSVLDDSFTVISLKEAGIDIDIPEPHDTLEENAREKSTVIHGLTGKNCFSEDTGLEVFALNGEPGVKSARYAGNLAGSAENISKLLTNMQGIEERAARFRTVISLILDDHEYQFEGICEGRITEEASGKEGFGYDRVFIPTGADKPFAEMDMAGKNIYSHRKKAMAKFIQFLKEYDGENQD
ncbi:MAG: rdgB [Ferruginibacter sp.]|nr:rdgB [Ferruginibacter sp.]